MFKWKFFCNKLIGTPYLKHLIAPLQMSEKLARGQKISGENIVFLVDPWTGKEILKNEKGTTVFLSVTKIWLDTQNPEKLCMCLMKLYYCCLGEYWLNVEVQCLGNQWISISYITCTILGFLQHYLSRHQMNARTAYTNECSQHMHHWD